MGVTYAEPRCTLTGVPITDAALVMVRRAPAKRVRGGYLQEDRLIAAPTTLHKHPYHGGTQRIGLAYSLLMSKYLDVTLKEASAAEQRELLDWWDTSYGCERVFRGLLEKLPEPAARHVLEVVSTLHREEADPADIAERFRHREDWVRKRVDWCMHIAHSTPEYCPCSACRKRRIA